MTTRAEEIAGPYKVKEFLGRECVVDTDNLILWRSEDKRLSEGVADCMNAAYLSGKTSCETEKCVHCGRLRSLPDELNP
jgi:hypothetical protein